MRKILLGFAIMFGASPAMAATRDQDLAACNSNNPDTSIAGCTDLIKSAAPQSGAGLGAEFLHRADAYFDKGLYKQALSDYGSAAYLTPTDPDVYSDLAATEAHLGDMPRALADAQKAYALKPSEDALFLRGQMYQLNKQNGLAIADYRAALKMNPNDGEAKSALAMLGAKP